MTPVLCKKPYMIGVVPNGCGQCLPCRINRRRLWTHRLMLESMAHVNSAFITLTYDKEHLPDGGQLVPKHVVDWLKRLRWKMEPEKVRYFLAGEYGDESWRPHYHVAAFGVVPCMRGRTNHYMKECCPSCQFIQDTWPFGRVDVGSLTASSASYIAGYVTKKMTSPKDNRLNGRSPEFARMSTHPGIGAIAMEDVARALKTEQGQKALSSVGDVPHALMHGRKSMPLGRYLRRKLREHLGRSPETPPESLLSHGVEMRALFEEAIAKTVPGSAWTLGSLFVDLKKQEVLNLESRTAVRAQRKVL